MPSTQGSASSATVQTIHATIAKFIEAIRQSHWAYGVSTTELTQGLCRRLGLDGDMTVAHLAQILERQRTDVAQERSERVQAASRGIMGHYGDGSFFNPLREVGLVDEDFEGAHSMPNGMPIPGSSYSLTFEGSPTHGIKGQTQAHLAGRIDATDDRVDVLERRIDELVKMLRVVQP